LYTKAIEAGDLAQQARISVLNNRCDGYLRKGDFAKARADCDNAIRLAVVHDLGQILALIYLTRGELGEADGDPRGAEQDFKKAYQIWPDHPAVKARAQELGLAN
jgi:Tfp pilus assembly protein PilF